MKILYLYSEVMGYTMATIRELANRGNEVHVVNSDHEKLTPYIVPKLKNVFMYNRSELSIDKIKELAEGIKPELTVVSGWMDKGYMKVAKKLRKEGLSVAVGLDSHWQGKPKQWLALILARIGYFSQFYSHAWVAGLYQFEYAQILGFDKKAIVFDLYCADLELFNTAYNGSIESKRNNYPHRFLFVGRFEQIKGLDTLLTAWQQLGQHRGDWELHLIGHGSLSESFAATLGVVVKCFMQPDKLVHEIAQAGCFILPSRGEPWGVVVHEFAAAGLPIIVSDVVGAATAFLVPGLNGYRFKANDAEQLALAMRKIVEQSDASLVDMGRASHLLSARITPVTSACNLLSVIQN